MGNLPLASRRRFGRLPWFPITLFLVWRLVIAIHAVVVVRAAPPVIPDWFLYQTPSRVSYEVSLPQGAPLEGWLEPWRRFDTTWYTHLALTGYTPNTVGIVFPPGYPLLIAPLAPLLGSAMLAAITVSNAACLSAFILLYRLIERHTGERRLARLTLLLFASYPAGFFLLAGYTESLFLALALGALTAAEDRRWRVSALCSLLVGIVRIQGFLIALPLAWIAYQQVRRERRASLPMVVALAAPLVSIGAYLLYLNANAMGILDDAWRSEWRAITVAPWVTVAAFLERAVAGRTLIHENRDAASVLFMLLMLLSLLWGALRQSLSSGKPNALRLPHVMYLLYSVPPFVLFLMRYVPNEAQFNSVTRYSIMLFPCFIAAAVLLRSRIVLVLVSLVLWYGQFDLVAQFVRWQWVA